MRKRLRETPELHSLYTEQYNHTRWKDHKVRVHSTIALAPWFTDARSGADLSCGDGAILKGISDLLGFEKTYFGDFVEGYQFHGPIEETIRSLPYVDMFILSETLEHLDDPDDVLRRIRKACKYLILTTPDGEWTDANPEHVWGWDTDEVRKILTNAGFVPEVYQSLSFPSFGYYTFQMWGCR